MSRTETTEYQAKLEEDGGVTRGRIPAPLIKDLGGRPGDYLVFKSNGAGSVQISVDRKRAGKARAARKR